MNKYKLLFLEIIIIITFLTLILFSIELFFLRVILGIICILFLPGYNFLSVVKSEFSIMRKLGYSTFISIALENLIMFFYYVLFFNFFASSSSSVFYFDFFLLIVIIQSINISLVLILIIKNIRKHTISNGFFNIKKFFNFIRRKYLILIVYLSYFISLILVCITTLYSNVPFTKQYRLNFTFFENVNYTFFIFLSISVLLLVFIIFQGKNKYIILISISAFLYVLWILPYLQLWVFFTSDAQHLHTICENYEEYGIRVRSNYSFVVRLKNLTTYRYCTNIFTCLLLQYSTGVQFNHILWYIYPMIFIFIPFLFYSIFEKFALKDNKHQKLNLFIIILLAISSAQFLKYPHSATTGVIGTVLYFILLIEFYEVIHQKSIKKKIRDFSFIWMLFLFLCITHLEECIYYILIVILYSLYYNLIESRKLKLLKNNSQIFRIEFYRVKINLIGIILTIFLSLLSLYLILEFFDVIEFFSKLIIGDGYKSSFLYTLYKDTKIVTLPILRGSMKISYFFISCIIIFTVLILLIHLILLYRVKKTDIILDSIKKTFNKFISLISRLTNKKIFQLLLAPFFFILIILIHIYYFPFLYEQGYLLILELFLNYTIIFIQVFLFIKGVGYYKSEDHKQNYFLITIISSFSILLLAFMIGTTASLAFYILNARFSSCFIFFNLIIIQDNYFKKFVKKKKVYLILFIILVLIVDIFYSLKKLSAG